MTNAEAEAVSGLFVNVLGELPYYNAAAKASELAKYSPTGLRETVAEDSEAILVARFQTQLVGFCFSRKDEGLIWMSWIGVRIDHRRKGLASLLLDALNVRAKRANAHKIWCDCRANNEASKRMLESRDYKEICLLTNHWHGQDYILWQKHVG